MKRYCLLIGIIAAFFTLISATVWEGSALVAFGGELPETGYFLATSSFPENTVVDVTNLDNGKTIRCTVAAGLEIPGLMALLSREAADIIELPKRTMGKIRMEQFASQAALPRIPGANSASGDPDYDPSAFVAMSGYDLSLLEEEKAEEEAVSTERAEGGEIIIDLPTEEELLARAAAEAAAAEAARAVPAITVPRPIQPAMAAEAPAAVTPPPAAGPAALGPDYDLSLIPAETRPPEARPEPDPSLIIPEVSQTPAPSSDYIDPSLVIPEISVAPAASQPVYVQQAPGHSPDYIDPSLIIPSIGAAPSAPKPYLPELMQAQPPVYSVPDSRLIPQPAFSAPLISSLEKGMYYLQIAAYSKAETVQSEIDKIGKAYPLSIMNAGNAEKPVYRILIGPVNLGESGALLQRFKTSYKDAFVRLGS